MKISIKVKIILLLIFLVLFTTCIPKRKSALEYKELGDRYRLNAKMKKSAKAIERAAELDPNNSDIYVDLAEAIMSAWTGKKANSRIREAYNTAFRIQPWSIKALLSRAKYHEFNSEYKFAERDLDSLLKRDASNLEAYLLKASLHFHDKDTSGFNILRSAYDKVSLNERSMLVHAMAFKELNLELYERSINNYKKEEILVGKKYSSTSCALAWAYSQIGNQDSTCFYYKMCEEKVFRTIINYDLLEKSCYKK